MFLYSAIARPGNSGGPIIAHDGRVIGIVVQDSMATSSTDPTSPAGRKAQERYPTLRAAWDECLGLLSCAPVKSAQQQADSSEDDLPDAAPFYRGIPASEILHALRNMDEISGNVLNLEALITFEDPLNL
jgi:hypothetical protein